MIVKLISKITGKGWSQPAFWSVDRPIIAGAYGPEEKIAEEFETYIDRIYRRDGIVFACIAARAMVFSQARFLWRRYINGRPTDLFGTRDLEILEMPWPNGSTGELLTQMEQDVSTAGNYFGTIIEAKRIRRLRPDWVSIVSGSATAPAELAGRAVDARILSYIYAAPGLEPEVFEPAEIIHYTETPDPLFNWRGMSWLTPILREIQGDIAASEHKLNFFRNGATPSMAITYDQNVSKEAFEAFVKKFEETHAGVDNAYKTLHLGGGADVTPLTKDFRELDFKSTQGAGETRIAAAAGAHPVIVGLAEGLQGSSLNAGNFMAARRLFVDGRIRSLWSKAAAALESVLTVPEGARLWYDDRDIPFLRQDAMDEAKIRQTDAIAMRQLIDAGFDPGMVVDAVTAGDLRRLRAAHSGLYSVQLQPANPNGNGSEPAGTPAQAEG